MTDATGSSAGVRAIVLYKTAKAAVQLGVVLLAIALWPFGLPGLVRELAVALHHHATRGWAISLAVWLEAGSTPHGVELSMLALGGDGTLTGVEAWALRRGHWWGPWLVVLATGSLLPFELFELVKTPRLSRALLLALNVVVVVYLARRARAERAHRSQRRSPSSQPPER
ncbi:MAG TPA: DUF2127 domain-containing protein [Polyangiaceae bacterium]|nr:DUF2127 domain-containing protein [Polyangiaceae bacterium]